MITFTGDAGFWYHIGELETAVRWKLNAITHGPGFPSYPQKIFFGNEVHSKSHSTTRNDGESL